MAPKAVKEITSQDVLKYRVKVQFLTRLLGTAPNDPRLYIDFTIGTAIDKALQKARTEEDKGRIEQLRSARIDHELTMLPGASNSALLSESPESVKDALGIATSTEEKGKTVFRSNKTGLILPG